MTTVGAYIEIPPGTPFHPENGLYTCFRGGEFEAKTPEGLEVYWPEGTPPEEAQVYLHWVPLITAVWEDPEEEEEQDAEGTD